ncbi:MAG: HAD family hydrolase [Mycobacteriales bacterium]
MIVYSDLDGTMVGPRGCFFRAADRSVTVEPARALTEFLAGDGTLVLVSGRSRAQLQEAALIFGADGFIAELGAIIARDVGRGVDLLPTDGPAADDALVDAMLADFAGRLEYHSPWHLGHEVDVMLRGFVPLLEAREWLVRKGFAHLELRDNGVLPRNRAPDLVFDGPLHVYHLVPGAVSKGAAVAYDLGRRGLTAADAVAVGDSASDLEMAAHVSRFFLVANGRVHLPGDLPENVTVTGGEVGLGWSEALRWATRAG